MGWKIYMNVKRNFRILKQTRHVPAVFSLSPWAQFKIQNYSILEINGSCYRSARVLEAYQTKHMKL